MTSDGIGVRFVSVTGVVTGLSGGFVFVDDVSGVRGVVRLGVSGVDVGGVGVGCLVECWGEFVGVVLEVGELRVLDC